MRFGQRFNYTKIGGIALLVIVAVAAGYFGLRYLPFGRGGLEIKLLTEEPKGTQNMNVTVELLVKNRGSEGVSNLSVEVSPMSEFLKVWAVGGFAEGSVHHLGYLEPGGERRLKYSVYIERNSYPGKYGLKITVYDVYWNILATKTIYIEVITKG